jgi:hypothetical protein
VRVIASGRCNLLPGLSGLDNVLAPVLPCRSVWATVDGLGSNVVVW